MFIKPYFCVWRHSSKTFSVWNQMWKKYSFWHGKSHLFVSFLFFFQSLSLVSDQPIKGKIHSVKSLPSFSFFGRQFFSVCKTGLEGCLLVSDLVLVMLISSRLYLGSFIRYFPEQVESFLTMTIFEVPHQYSGKDSVLSCVGLGKMKFLTIK